MTVTLCCMIYYLGFVPTIWTYNYLTFFKSIFWSMQTRSPYLCAHTLTHIQVQFAIVLWARMADGRWRLLSLCPWLRWHHQRITAVADWQYWSSSLQQRACEGQTASWMNIISPNVLTVATWWQTWGKTGMHYFKDNPLIMLCLRCDMIFHMAFGKQLSEIRWKWNVKYSWCL